jgi:pyruvate dehydrogenase E2 component (dihydrolipoamide acetyltransferase)
MSKEIKLPEIADNVTTAVVLDIVVSVGDTINADDVLAEMESDKASFELPSEVAGVVKEIKVGIGDEVKVGQVMFIIDDAEGAKDSADKADDKSSEKTKDEPNDEPAEKQQEDDHADDEKPEVSDDQNEKKPSETTEPAISRKEMPDPEDEPGARASAAHVAASPAVRRLAREIGVDITRVKGSGPNDRITDVDVKAFAKKALEGKPSATAIADDYQLPDFSKYGNVRREKMDTIRKITARTLAESWQTIPHVFQFDKADVTDLEKFRQDYSKYVEKKGAKLTVTAILLKLTAMALKTFPRFNASLDMRNEEIIYKDYVNIGVAVDTERGLLVPVIRDVDKKSITDLSLELNELAEKARTKKIKPDELQGGNFAISNLGGIGGTHFTPIVYRPNVAILGVSRSQMEPVFIDGEFKPRLMLPLSLSYDHRIIDGADGARFLRWLCDAMQNPLLTMF